MIMLATELNSSCQSEHRIELHLERLPKYEFRNEILRISFGHLVTEWAHLTFKPFVKGQRTFHTNINNLISFDVSYGTHFTGSLLLTGPKKNFQSG